MKNNLFCSKLILCAVLFVVSVLPYSRAAKYDLINLDDYAYVENCEEIVGGLTPRNILWAFTTTKDFIYMPLTRISYQLDWSLASSENVHQQMHMHSLLIHGLNAVLLAVLLMMFSDKPIAAVAAAAIWAVHPLRVESVAWIASRKDLVSLFWLLFALIFWVKFRRAKDPFKWYGLSITSFVLALLSKPSAMTFPFLVAVLDIFYLRKLSRIDFDNIWSRAYVVPLAIFVGIAWFTKSCQDAGLLLIPEVAAAPLPYRILNAAVSYGIYILHTIWPVHLAPQCAIRYPSLPRLFYIAIPITITVLWLGVRSFRHRGSFAMCLAWYTVSIGPMLGVAAFGHHAFADRFTYIPAIGFSFFLLEFCRNCRWRMFLLLVMIAFSLLSYHQTSFWHDDKSLFEHLLAVDGENNYAAHFDLAYHHWEITHDLSASIEHFNRGRKLAPVYAMENGRAALQLMALCEIGDVDNAVELLHALTVHEQTKYQGRALTDGLIAARGIYFLTIGNIAQAKDDLAFLEQRPNTKRSLHTRYLKSKIRGCLEGKAGELDEQKKLIAERPKCLDYARYRFLESRGQVR